MKSIRKSKGITRNQLSEATGITENLIGLYETGKRLAPLDKIFDLANALKTSVVSLTGDNEYNLAVPTPPDPDRMSFEYRFHRADGVFGVRSGKNGDVNVYCRCKEDTETVLNRKDVD